MRYLKRIAVFVLFLLVLGSGNAHAEYYMRNTTLIDTPTAYTIGRGTYQVEMLGYDNGGIEFQTFIGLHDNLFLGFSIDIENAIGKEKTKPNVPGVIAKLKFTDGWQQFPISIAVGYESFYIGEPGKTYNQDNELNRMIYGPYGVITKPIYLFDSEQHIHFGVRVPTQPEYMPGNTSYFFSFDIPMGEYFMFKTETERVYYDFSRNEDWLLNFGLRYSYLQQFAIEFDVLLEREEKPNRIVKVEYKDSF